MVIWFTGLSGSGKSILSQEIAKNYHSQTRKLPIILDGDVLRASYCDDLGYNQSDRIVSSYRKSRLAKIFFDQGHFIICSLVCLYPEVKEWIEQKINKNKFIFIETPIEDLIKRDSKDLYKGALNGTTSNVAGVNLEYPIFANPDYYIFNNQSEKKFLEHAKMILDLCEL